MRFCLITTFYPPFNFGGDGIYVQRLANALAELGHKVEVIHCRDSYRALAQNAPATDYHDHGNVTVHGLESRFGLLSPLATHQLGAPLLHAAALRKILQNDFDVIHFHNISLIGGPAVLRYGRAIKLYTIHEYWLVCPTHTLFKYNQQICENPHCIRCSLSYRRPPQWWRYFGALDRAVRNVDAFIAPSRFCKNLHERSALAAPVVHIANFVPAAPVREAELETSSNETFFLYCGRLEKLKGVQTLIPIFRQFRRAALWIAGSGGYKTELQRLAANSLNVRFLGFADKDRLLTLYRCATAVIVPSICFEVFPTVAIEALSQGTPIIVRNLGAMPEAVEDSGAGFIYNTDAELVAAMEQLLNDPRLRDELGRRGRAAYQRHWTTEAHLQHYFKLIDELKERPRRH